MAHHLPGSIKAVVFDLDGTLIDSEADLRAAVNRVFDEIGRRPITRNEVVMMVGDGVPKLVERALEATGGLPDDGTDDVVARFLEFYEGHATDLSQPFPGAQDILRELVAAGARIGLCTNKPEAPAHEILEFFGIAKYFGAVVGGDSLPGIRKPDPRHLAAVLEKLGTDPAHAVMVGDNANDIQTAQALGVPAIAVSFGYPRGPIAALNADVVIDQFDDLWDVLAGLA